MSDLSACGFGDSRRSRAVGTRPQRALLQHRSLDALENGQTQAKFGCYSPTAIGTIWATVQTGPKSGLGNWKGVAGINV